MSRWRSNEATCQLAAGLDLDQVGIDAVPAMVEPVGTHFLWRPQLSKVGISSRH
jgi:hypothetical protein